MPILQRTSSTASRKGSRDGLLPSSRDDLVNLDFGEKKPKNNITLIIGFALLLTICTGLVFWAYYPSEHPEATKWNSDYITTKCSKNKAHKFSLCQTCSAGVPATIRLPEKLENGDVTMFYNARWAVPLKIKSPKMISNVVNGVEYELTRSKTDDKAFYLSVKVQDVEMCVIDLRRVHKIPTDKKKQKLMRAKPKKKPLL
eukprot:CFRG5156T1